MIADANDEANESLSVTLHNPAHVNLADPTANGTIVDDDAMPVVSIVDTSIREPRTGYVIVPVHVTLTVASGKQVTVWFSTANGSAKAAATTSPRPERDVPSGQTGKNIRVRVLSDDDRDEANEAFCVDLFSPMNATLGHSVATVVIRHP